MLDDFNAICAGFEQFKVAKIGDQHEAIGREIVGNLLGASFDREGRRDIVRFDDAALGCRAARCPTDRLSATELLFHEKAEVRITGASARHLAETVDVRVELGADCIEHSLQRAIVGGLPGARAGCVNARNLAQIGCQDPVFISHARGGSNGARQSARSRICWSDLGLFSRRSRSRLISFQRTAGSSASSAGKPIAAKSGSRA